MAGVRWCREGDRWPFFSFINIKTFTACFSLERNMKLVNIFACFFNEVQARFLIPLPLSQPDGIHAIHHQRQLRAVDGTRAVFPPHRRIEGGRIPSASSTPHIRRLPSTAPSQSSFRLLRNTKYCRIPGSRPTNAWERAANPSNEFRSL